MRLLFIVGLAFASLGPIPSQAAPSVASSTPAATATPVSPALASPKAASPPAATKPAAAAQSFASSASGGVGLVHTLAAEPGKPGTLRLGVFGEFFHVDDFPIDGATNQRSAATLSLAYTPVRYVDVYAAYALSSNHNSRALPTLIQTLGDTWLGAKAGARVSRALYVGGDLRFSFFPGLGEQAPMAVGIAPRALLSFDARELKASAPLRAHVNAGVVLDSTGTLSAERLTVAEQFGLGVNAYHRFAGAAALELPLAFVTPFVEYGLEVPLGAPETLRRPDGFPSYTTAASPMRVTFGARVTAVEELAFTLATDVGLQGKVVEGIAATPPYNVYLGIGYTLDPAGKPQPPKIIERVEVKAPPPSTGEILGTVLDDTTGEPLGGAFVSLRGAAHATLPPVATAMSTGAFRSYELAPGPVELVVEKDGYDPATFTAQIAAGTQVPAQIRLHRQDRPGTLKVSVAGPKGPLDAATVTLEGPKPGQLTLAAGAAETQLPKGTYRVRIAADGFLSREGSVEIADNATASIAFELSPKPKRTVLIIRKDKILTRRTVQFRSGQSEILPESYPILDEVAAAIIDGGYKKIRVDGHTDNQGGKGFNQQLSERRAAAIQTYFVNEAGIAPDRLTAAGFGDARPIAPNLTARGRAMNRRVEFSILEK